MHKFVAGAAIVVAIFAFPDSARADSAGLWRSRANQIEVNRSRRFRSYPLARRYYVGRYYTDGYRISYYPPYYSPYYGYIWLTP
jgi:hypothetical protein